MLGTSQFVEAGWPLAQIKKGAASRSEDMRDGSSPAAALGGRRRYVWVGLSTLSIFWDRFPGPLAQLVISPIAVLLFLRNEHSLFDGVLTFVLESFPAYLGSKFPLSVNQRRAIKPGS